MDKSKTQPWHLRRREHGGRRCGKIVKAREDQEVCSRWCLLVIAQQYGSLNKTQTIAKTNSHANMGEGNLKRLPLLDEEVQATNDCQEKDLSFSGMRP